MEASSISEEPEISLKKVFDEFDKDANGTICAAKFPDVVQATRVDATKEDIGAVMKKYDKNDDGTIDFSEFVDMIQEFETSKEDSDTVQENLRQAFR